MPPPPLPKKPPVAYVNQSTSCDAFPPPTKPKPMKAIHTLNKPIEDFTQSHLHSSVITTSPINTDGVNYSERPKPTPRLSIGKKLSSSSENVSTFSNDCKQITDTKISKISAKSTTNLSHNILFDEKSLPKSDNAETQSVGYKPKPKVSPKPDSFSKPVLTKSFNNVNSKTSVILSKETPDLKSPISNMHSGHDSNNLVHSNVQSHTSYIESNFPLAESKFLTSQSTTDSKTEVSFTNSVISPTSIKESSEKPPSVVSHVQVKSSQSFSCISSKLSDINKNYKPASGSTAKKLHPKSHSINILPTRSAPPPPKPKTRPSLASEHTNTCASGITQQANVKNTLFKPSSSFAATSLIDTSPQTDSDVSVGHKGIDSFEITNLHSPVSPSLANGSLFKGVNDSSKSEISTGCSQSPTDTSHPGEILVRSQDTHKDLTTCSDKNNIKLPDKQKLKKTLSSSDKHPFPKAPPRTKRNKTITGGAVFDTSEKNASSIQSSVSLNSISLPQEEFSDLLLGQKTKTSDNIANETNKFTDYKDCSIDDDDYDSICENVSNTESDCSSDESDYIYMEPSPDKNETAMPLQKYSEEPKRRSISPTLGENFKSMSKDELSEARIEVERDATLMRGVNIRRSMPMLQLKQKQKSSISSMPPLADVLIPPALLSLPQSFDPRKSLNHSCSDINSNDSENCQRKSRITLEDEDYRELKKSKTFCVAEEIMTTEQTFLGVLRLLNIEFRHFVSENSIDSERPVVPVLTLNQILNNLPQIEQLSQDLLHDLEERISNWKNNPRISDIFVMKGPFLKLYTAYIRDFEVKNVVLDDARRRYPEFDEIIKKFELTPKMANLTLKHYMLKPIQRIPQYKLLLQDYRKHLSEDSPDFKSTEVALAIVSEVAEHANQSMKYGDNFKKLWEIQNNLIGSFEVIKPGRTFIKEGVLMKLSRKGLQPRMFFLLSDVLLYTIPISLTAFKMKISISLTGMTVSIPTKEDFKNEFNIHSTKKSFRIVARTAEERDEWINVLKDNIVENVERRFSFGNIKFKQKPIVLTEEIDVDFVLGSQAPVWIPDDRVTMCMLCTNEFSIFFRRHHCRSCGKVVCYDCSNYKAPLHYLNDKSARVCYECFGKLETDFETKPDSQGLSSTQSVMRSRFKGERFVALSKTTKSKRPAVLHEVRATDDAVDMSGYLFQWKNKKWKRLWFVVKDKALYFYKASADAAATDSVVLLSYAVKDCQSVFEDVDSECLFEINHKGTETMIFRAETEELKNKWVKAIYEATLP